jgi:hypothetical protein
MLPYLTRVCYGLSFSTPAISCLRGGVDPVGDFGFDGLGEHPLGTAPAQLGEKVFCLRRWHNACIYGRTSHGGVLLCLVGNLVTLDPPRVRRLFFSAIHKT